jgi:hypothetical protein
VESILVVHACRSFREKERLVVSEAFQAYLRKAHLLVSTVAERMSQIDVIAAVPELQQTTFLGLVARPVGSVVCAVAVAPREPPHVVVAYEANPLYCPGPFYVVQPIGQSSAARRRYRAISLPTVDLSPGAFDVAVEAVTFCVRHEFPYFCDRYGTPESVVELLHRGDSVDTAEALAYSLLRIGRFDEAAGAFREIANLKPNRVDPDDREGLSAAIGRAVSAIRDLEAGPAAVAATLAEVEGAKLARYGLPEQAHDRS